MWPLKSSDNQWFRNRSSDNRGTTVFPTEVFMMCIVVFVYSARIIVLCVHVQSTVVPVLSALKVYVILRRNVPL